MTDSDFLLLIQETLNREDPVSMNTRFDDMPEWDSLSAMAVVGMAERSFGRRLKLAELSRIDTVAELYALLS